MKSNINLNWLKLITVLIVLNPVISAQAQISSDGSLSTKIITTDNLNFEIEDGNPSGNNLFHSFNEFSVPTNGSAFFNNALNINNIFTRITGGKISNIDGFLGANGSANLFFLNPQGVIFGPNANLGLGGSLVVTTAESLKFEDGTVFSVGLGGTNPLLTQTAPVGLQYGTNPGAIVNQSTYTPPSPPLPPGFPDAPPPPPSLPVGLELAEGQTLALLGGKIENTGGYISAPGGRIELGSVATNSIIGLESGAQGFAVNYQGVENFDDITINQASLIDVTSSNPFLPSGNLQIQGKNVLLSESSQISSVTLFSLPGGNLVLNASESVEIIGNSEGGFGDTNLSTSTFDNGNAGNIEINTKNLRIGAGGAILTNTLAAFNPEAEGNSGNLTIKASESLKISGISPITARSSLLTVATSTNGQGGDLNINTPNLQLENGGQISARSTAVGKGGTINLNSTTVELNGISSDTEGEIIASSILANTEGAGEAGDIKINTDNLTIKNQASIIVSGTSTGAAGNLDINANNLYLDNSASLRAETAAGDQGSINLNVAKDIQLRHQSNITAEATGLASGGNVNLNAIFLVGLEDSDIIANAELGSGGNIQIKATGIFLAPDSTITASSQFGVDGIVQVNTPDVQLDSALAELKASFVPTDQIIASSCISRQNTDKGRFVVTGTGGLPYTPFDPLRGDYGLTSVQGISATESPNSVLPSNQEPKMTWQPGQPIQEAQGITVTSDGKIMLGNFSQVATVTKANQLICP